MRQPNDSKCVARNGIAAFAVEQQWNESSKIVVADDVDRTVDVTVDVGCRHALDVPLMLALRSYGD